VLLGAATAGLSLRSLTLVAANADLLDLAVAIEQGSAPEADYLARFVAAGGLAGGSDDCNDAVTRARLTVAWAALKAAPAADLEARRELAMAAARRRLNCDPLDGNALLRYAMIAQRGGAPTEQIVAALAASYRAAPSEAWIVEPRLDFATTLLLAGVTGFEAEYAADLGRFVAFESITRVAAAYVAAPTMVRRLMRPPIDALVDPRRRMLLTAIDRLGVDYPHEAP
jgi:hypothetical protein